MVSQGILLGGYDFLFKVTVWAFTAPGTRPTHVEGLASSRKRRFLRQRRQRQDLQHSTPSPKEPQLSHRQRTGRRPHGTGLPHLRMPAQSHPQTIAVPDEIADQFDGNFNGFVPPRDSHYIGHVLNYHARAPGADFGSYLRLLRPRQESTSGTAAASTTRAICLTRSTSQRRVLPARLCDFEES